MSHRCIIAIPFWIFSLINPLIPQPQPLNMSERHTSNQMKPLMVEMDSKNDRSEVPFGNSNNTCLKAMAENPEFFKQAGKFLFCFCGLQASYLTWGFMQELIMTSNFTPTERVPDGKFPSAQFCVFSNRFLAVLVAIVAVKLRHGAVWANNVAPTIAFTPCAFSNTMSSWSQYKSLEYVSFPVSVSFLIKWSACTYFVKLTIQCHTAGCVLSVTGSNGL